MCLLSFDQMKFWTRLPTHVLLYSLNALLVAPKAIPGSKKSSDRLQLLPNPCTYLPFKGHETRALNEAIPKQARIPAFLENDPLARVARLTEIMCYLTRDKSIGRRAAAACE